MNDIVVKATPFQVYRHVPLDKVLYMMGADLNVETQNWDFSNGVSFKIEGVFGNESWKNLSTQNKGRGAIDLVKHVSGNEHAGKALNYLKEGFPFATEQMPDWVLTLSPNPLMDVESNSVAPKAVSTPPTTTDYEKVEPPKHTASVYQIYRQIPLSRVFAALEAIPNDQGEWQIPNDGDVYTFTGELGSESWKNKTRNTKGFGAIDLIKEFTDGAPKSALMWLQKKFPFALSQMPELVLNPQPKSEPEKPKQETSNKSAIGSTTSSGYNETDVPKLAREYTSSELFRAYRHIPLEKVLTVLKGVVNQNNSSNWTLSDGVQVIISGDFGNENWEIPSVSKSGKGSLDFVNFVKQHKSIGSSLSWLKYSFPYGVEQVPEEFLSAAPTNSNNNAVRKKPELSEAEKAAIQKKRDEQDLRQKAYDLKDAMSLVDIAHVFPLLGGYPHGADASKWHIPTVGTFIIKDNRWQNVHTQVDKGFGGVELIMHAKSVELDEALKLMVENFGENVDASFLADIDLNKKKKDFTPPERFDETLPEVRRYLCEERGIPEELIDALIEDGSIYGTHPWFEKEGRYITNVNRCVFLAESSAELRDTDPDGLKACCDGSETDFSGFSIKPNLKVSERIVSLQEAAIDSLSYSAMFPGRYVLSTNGAGRFLLQFRAACEAINLGLGVRASFDADGPGDSAAQKLFSALYVCESLSRRLEVPVETVQEWFLKDSISVVPSMSPHLMFFANGASQLQEEYDVHEAVEDGLNAEGYPRMVWKSTGVKSYPAIELNVIDSVHPKLKKGKMTLKVTQAGMDYVVNELDFNRERPVFTKDWNDDFKGLGRAYVQAYNTAVKNDFKNGLPNLPPEFDKFRREEFRKYPVVEKKLEEVKPTSSNVETVEKVTPTVSSSVRTPSRSP